MLTGLTSTDPSTWPDALHKVRQRQKELKMVDSALVFHIKDVYRERLKGLIRQAADVSVPMEAALMRGETVADTDAKEAKLRNVIGAAMLLMRLMRQFLEVCIYICGEWTEGAWNLMFLCLINRSITSRK